MEYFRLIENIPGRSPLGFGQGAGRWNPHGVPMIYACNFTSLNFLELLSIRGSMVRKAAWSLVVYEIKEDIPFLELESLPENWNSLPHSTSTQIIGSFWSKSQDSCALIVPSSRIPLYNYPKEHNLLINPLFPDLESKVKIKELVDVSFTI